MKLSEITLVPNHQYKRFNISDFDIDHGQQFGYSEGGTKIIKATSPKDRYATVFALYSKDGILLSAVIGYFRTWNNSEYFSILDVYTSPQYRRQGYATALYVSLVTKYNVKLISDAEQTQYGKKLWDGISKILNVKVHDNQTDQLLPRSSVSDADIYHDQPERYLLIVEHIKYAVGLSSTEIPTVGDGILDDYMIYTHPENIGKYY